MLDGREVDGKIGNYGGYFVDVSDNGDIEIGVAAKANLFDELENLAESKNLDWLKKGVQFLRELVAKDEESEPEQPA